MGDVHLYRTALADNEIEEFKDAFKIFDNDQNGKIDADELESVFTNLGFQFTRDQIQQMMRAVDDNDDNVIDIDEFIALMKVRKSKAGRKKKTYKEELKDAFNVFDVDKNGFISANELSTIMNALGENLSE